MGEWRTHKEDKTFYIDSWGAGFCAGFCVAIGCVIVVFAIKLIIDFWPYIEEVIS